MPVARGPQINARSAVLVGLTGVVVALLLGGLVIWLAASSDTVDVRLGDRDFDAGHVGAISAAINGPILYSDVGTRRSRDIVVQHLGTDVETGWLAFAARRAEDQRDCFLQWQPDNREFRLTSATDTVCDDVTVDEAGTGLQHYVTEVRDGRIHVLLNDEVEQ